jgi:hypothetical protein
MPRKAALFKETESFIRWADISQTTACERETQDQK